MMAGMFDLELPDDEGVGNGEHISDEDDDDALDNDLEVGFNLFFPSLFPLFVFFTFFFFY